MELSRDVLQKIAEKSDDKTALKLLSSSNKLNTDYYFQIVFGHRYPDLVKYLAKNETLRKLYLRMLKAIGSLKEKYGYIYQTGDPVLQLKILLEYTSPIVLLVEGAIENSIEIVKYAFEKGADLHFDDDMALIYASSGGHLEIVKYLVEHGANINAQHGYALGSASLNGHLETVKYLVEHGANIHSHNDFALGYASFYGHLEIVKYLVEHGDNIHAEDNFGLRFARENNHLDVVKYLEEHA